MKIRISCGASMSDRNRYDDRDWFVVHPLDGRTETSVAGTPITHDMAVMSLLAAGRPVYELEIPDNPNDPTTGPNDWHYSRITLTP